ncbi:MAG: hypothetical protein ABW321_22050 [Polyangiales bacterium]
MTSSWPQIVLCVVLAGCDQFARVGLLPLDGSSGVAAGEAAPPDAGMQPDPACVRPAVAVCDPVINEGCPAALRMQCAVDFASDALAGYCIFQGPPAPNGSPTCLNTIATESCGPTTTCVFGTCRALCFCDSDCAAGECCREKIGDLGFKVCSSC